MDQQKQRKRKRALLENVQEDDGNSKFARALGSVDNQTREKGLQALSIWLSKKDDLTEQDLTRLWKGIFYCFWHADKAPFQVAFLYFTVFLSTMRREWFGIDKLRLDKFMMLVRKFTRSMFQYLQAQQWDVAVVQRFMAYIQKDVLLSTDSHPAAGLTYHLADVYVVELTEVSQSGPPSAAVLTALLAPFCEVLAKSNRAAFLPRLREAIFDTLIREVVHPCEKRPLRHLAVQELADHLFELGASSETHAKNRHELYEVSQVLQQAAKKLDPARAGKQAKHSASNKQKVNLKADAPAKEPAALSDLRSEPGASRTKHKCAPSADGDACGWVESPDAFAKEVTAALHKAADDLPQAALTQVNGKQLKKLKKKQQKTASVAPGEAAVMSISQQKHEAQLAGAAEAVPLKLKEAKLAQRQQSADMQDMGAALQPLSSGNPIKRQRRQGNSRNAAASKTQSATVAEGLPLAKGHSTGTDSGDGTASQRKKRVRFAMKRNLLMQIGGAVPPEEIRTPPDSRPKGSALKRSSLVNHREALSNSSGKRRDQKAGAKAKAGNPHGNAQAKLFF